MMLYKLLKAAPPTRLESLVISLGECGLPASLIEGLGIQVVSLGLHRGDRRSLRFLPRTTDAYRTLKRFQPQLLSGWMYHGNIAAWLLGRKLATPLVWNIRQTLNLAKEKPLTRCVIRVGAYLSRTPERLIYVSRQAREQHRSLGYRDDNALVLPNGFDLDAFRRDVAAGLQLRRELRISDDTCVVGHLARYHPMKDQLGLIGAARAVVAEERSVVFLLAGKGLSDGNGALVRAVRECALERHVRLLGETASPQEFLSACDLFCLPSAWGEGFPNSVGEAMACELPCVVTRVGDSPDLVDSTGLVIEPGDRQALAEAILQLVRLGRTGRGALGRQARARIAARFSLAQVAARYFEVFEGALCRRGVKVG